jgi:transglutaminase-like putative cysteine protease
MSQTRDPDRLIRAYLDEGRTELSDRTYDAVRAGIDRTRQRRVLGRWNERRVPSVARFGIAAVAVLMAGAVGVAVIAERSTGGDDSGSLGLVSAQVRSEWVTDDSVAFTVERDPSDGAAYYWRAVTYDRLDLHGFGTSSTKSLERPAGSPILEGTADEPTEIGTRVVTFTVRPVGFSQRTIMSPATPIGVDTATRLSTVGADGYFATLDRSTGSSPYTVTARVPIRGEGQGQLDHAALLAAGTNYPADVRAMYTHLSPGMWGPNLELLQQKVVAAAMTSEPIDVAQALQAELRSTSYTYATDMRDVDCASMSTAECFATVKRGFCQWYAPTMAVVLRHLGIPARIVVGFLPGERSGDTEVVRNLNAHAWVEVYFPGHGWVTFDPTGGQATQLPSPTPNPVATP